MRICSLLISSYPNLSSNLCGYVVILQLVSKVFKTNGRCAPFKDVHAQLLNAETQHCFKPGILGSALDLFSALSITL